MLANAQAYAELGDEAGRRDPPDPGATSFREPQVAIGARGDADRASVRAQPGAELGDDALGGNPPDLIDARWREIEIARFRKPQIAIRAGGDVVWVRASSDTGAELSDDAKQSNSADPVRVGLREP